MTLLQFSTGEYHPLAHRPRIDVQLEDYERSEYISMLEIAGDNLALLIDARGRGQVFIFDWKTGHKRLVRSYTSNPCPSSFLNIALFAIATSNFGGSLL